VSWVCWKMLNELGWRRRECEWWGGWVGERRRLVLPLCMIKLKGGMALKMLLLLLHLCIWPLLGIYAHLKITLVPIERTIEMQSWGNSRWTNWPESIRFQKTKF
jgi:hypothetical protein